jgi:nitroimidazol reductase NimA-like FMN-containing flavoprotein (pyridoxamine 5'-phosphate oxidase superfamily)
MSELFHTEDCGLSLVCRCRHDLIYEAHPTCAERAKRQRQLRSFEHPHCRPSIRFGHAKWLLKKHFGDFAGLSNRFAGWIRAYLQEQRDIFMVGSQWRNSDMRGLRTERTRVRRRPERASYDRTVVYQIIDEALYCHVGFVHHGQCYVIPTIHARIGNQLYIHGAAASRLLGVLAGGNAVCVTLTLLDGVVLARSAFHHSMNYRSAMILGRPVEVIDDSEKMRALQAIVEHMVAGRWKDVRHPNDKELKATKVLGLSIDEASAKIRTGPPIDDEQDYEVSCWAGEIPLELTSRSPRPDPHLQPDRVAPIYVQQYCRPPVPKPQAVLDEEVVQGRNR